MSETIRIVYGKSDIVRQYGFDRAARQVAVAGLAARRAAEASRFADRVRREIVVQHKAALYFTLFDVVHVLLVHLWCRAWS